MLKGRSQKVRRQALTLRVVVRVHAPLPISPKYKGSVHKSAEASDSGVVQTVLCERTMMRLNSGATGRRIVSDVDNKRMPTDYRKHSTPLTQVSHAMKKVCHNLGLGVVSPYVVQVVVQSRQSVEKCTFGSRFAILRPGVRSPYAPPLGNTWNFNDSECFSFALILLLMMHNDGLWWYMMWYKCGTLYK